MSRRMPSAGQTPDQQTFAALLLAACMAVIGLVIVLVTAVADGAFKHAGGILTQACTTLAQFTGGATALTVLAIPALAVIAAAVRITLIHVRTQRRLRPLLAGRCETPADVKIAAASAGVRPQQLVYAQNEELIAWAFGLVRPRVLISSAAVYGLTMAELRAVLSHEAHHLKRLDPLRMLLAHIAAAGLFMVPVIEDLRRHFVLTAELAADRAALASAGRASLASALMKFLAAPRASALPSIAPGCANDVRITHLLDPHNFDVRFTLTRTSVIRTAAFAICMIALLALLALLPPMT